MRRRVATRCCWSRPVTSPPAPARARPSSFTAGCAAGPGPIGLVREALHERAHLLRNAPALVHPLRFVVPARTRLERATLGLGLGLRPPGRGGRDRSQCDARCGGPARGPAGAARGWARGRGGLWDAQFDDAGLALALARTAVRLGALVLNHCALRALVVEAEQVRGVCIRDTLSGREWTVGARCVVNAAGVWGDAVRRLADPAAVPCLRPSQGVHGRGWRLPARARCLAAAAHRRWPRAVHDSLARQAPDRHRRHRRAPTRPTSPSRLPARSTFC